MKYYTMFQFVYNYENREYIIDVELWKLDKSELDLYPNKDGIVIFSYNVGFEPFWEDVAARLTVDDIWDAWDKVED